MDYFGARYFSSKNGIWTSVDPSRLAPDDWVKTTDENGNRTYVHKSVIDVYNQWVREQTRKQQLSEYTIWYNTVYAAKEKQEQAKKFAKNQCSAWRYINEASNTNGLLFGNLLGQKVAKEALKKVYKQTIDLRKLSANRLGNFGTIVGFGLTSLSVGSDIGNAKYINVGAKVVAVGFGYKIHGFGQLMLGADVATMGFAYTLGSDPTQSFIDIMIDGVKWDNIDYDAKERATIGGK